MPLLDLNRNADGGSRRAGVRWLRGRGAGARDRPRSLLGCASGARIVADEHGDGARAGERGTVWIELGDDGSRALCVAGEAPHVGRRLRDYLKREAKRELEAASRRAADALGVKIKRVSIRDQSSRWGSCSTTGVLSYSWRLILTPPFVLDYLAAHEVAHLVEMNHSRAFWRVVGRIYPNMARAKTWLDVHGADLHRYGVGA